MRARLLIVFASAWLVAFPALQAAAADDQSSSASLVPPTSAGYDTFQPPWLSGRLGLRPQPDRSSATGIASGLRYYSDTRSLLVSLDQDESWRVGIGLNIGGTPKVEGLQSGGLGLQYKGNAPGIMLEKKF
jgi:hypothetical protein